MEPSLSYRMHRRWIMPFILLVVATLTSGCVGNGVLLIPPSPTPGSVLEPLDEAAVVPSPTSSPAAPTGEVPFREAGIAIIAEDGDAASSYHLQSVYDVMTWRSYLEFEDYWNGDPKDYPNGNLLDKQGQVEAVLIDSGSGARKLYYARPAAGVTITPTAWSEYALSDDPNAAISTLYLEPVTITSTEQYDPSLGAGPAPVVRDTLQALKDAGVNLSHASRLLLTVQENGGTRHYLITLEPESGAGCNWIQACTRCTWCPYRGICQLAKRAAGKYCKR